MTDQRRRLIGISVLVLGGIVVLIGVIRFITSGDGEEATPTQTEATTAPTSSESSPSSSTTTTTTSTTTTTTTEPPDEALDAARMAVGTYEGEWVNLTFGSRGPITVVVTLNETTRVLTITADLGGNVFGGSDPPPIAVDLDIDDVASEFTSPLFGDVTVSIDDGNLMLSAVNIPAPGIARMTVTGVVSTSGSSMEYAIEFDDGSGAEGTATLGAVTPPAAEAADSTSKDSTSEDSSSEGATDQTVEEFFPEYVAAIANGDVDFLFDRLHPVVLAQPSADLCRAFIEREILALGNYRITGDVTGPASQTIAGTEVAEVFTVPVAFEFQGQTFEATATFAAVDGRMHWFTECR